MASNMLLGATMSATSSRTTSATPCLGSLWIFSQYERIFNVSSRIQSMINFNIVHAKPNMSWGERTSDKLQWKGTIAFISSLLVFWSTLAREPNLRNQRTLPPDGAYNIILRQASRHKPPEKSSGHIHLLLEVNAEKKHQYGWDHSMIWREFKCKRERGRDWGRETTVVLRFK